MKIALIGIGLPGSGKTTVLKPLAVLDRYAYICPDDIRAALTGNASDQTRNREVWAETYRQVHAELGAGRNVVIDATNAKQHDRLAMIAHCRLKADQIRGLWVTAPYRVILERNQGRQRVVPDFSIGLMAGWLEAHPPRESEGFDKLVEYDNT